LKGCIADEFCNVASVQGRVVDRCTIAVSMERLGRRVIVNRSGAFRQILCVACCGRELCDNTVISHTVGNLINTSLSPLHILVL